MDTPFANIFSYEEKVLLLNHMGWSPYKTSCYDEEGVEGWTWTHDQYTTEYTELGEWDEPAEIPEELIYSLNESLQNHFKAVSVDPVIRVLLDKLLRIAENNKVNGDSPNGK